jgi:predicted HTH transcriptional regulator
VSTIVLDDIIKHPFEEKNIEFKKSTAWNDLQFKAKITKSIMGMANLRDGGWIVIGKEKQSDGVFQTIGMNQTDFDSYDSDLMNDFIKDYAYPEVKFVLYKRYLDGKRFVIIKIEEFEQIPIICKKAYGDIVHRGKIYTRTGKPETVEVPSQTEMREIIELAADKELRKFIGRAAQLGLIPAQKTQEKQADRELFRKELEDLL